MLKAGNMIPEADLGRLGAGGTVETVPILDHLKQYDMAILVGMPGSFTPVCSSKHLPSIIASKACLFRSGVESINILTPDNPWSMQAWADSIPGADGLMFLSDGNREFLRHSGMSDCVEAFYLGRGYKRFLAVLNRGFVTRIAVETSILEVTCTDGEAAVSMAKALAH
tara:strand:+ start:505 stop:1008 length:504 start_codon:yes stop_codon:yes gene_type:complete